MKRFFAVLAILFCCYFLTHGTAQAEGEGEIHELIELEGDKGRILVFPSTLPGPNGSVIKFIMFGVYEIPEVVIDTVTETIPAQVITIYFEEGYRFSGWFDAPKEMILSIWINGWFVHWGDKR